MTQDLPVIAMWSGPRNLSTALMRSFAQRDDCDAIDEPFYAAYLAHTGLAHPMRDDIIAAGLTDPAMVVERCLQGPTPPARLVYQKHMTHHMLDDFDQGWIDRVRNAFLIRSPERVLASYVAKTHRTNAGRDRLSPTATPLRADEQYLWCPSARGRCRRYPGRSSGRVAAALQSAGDTVRRRHVVLASGPAARRRNLGVGTGMMPFGDRQALPRRAPRLRLCPMGCAGSPMTCAKPMTNWPGTSSRPSNPKLRACRDSAGRSGACAAGPDARPNKALARCRTPAPRLPLGSPGWSPSAWI